MKGTLFFLALFLALSALPIIGAEPDPAPAKEVKPGYLGLQLDDMAGGQAAPGIAKGKKNEGAGVLEVMDDTPAAKAGIKDGDRVVKFDGKEVRDSKRFREMVRAAKPEQAVVLTVRRDEKEIEIKATLGAAPDNPVGFQLGGERGPMAVPGIVFFSRLRNFPQRDPEDGIDGGTGAAAGNKDAVDLRDGNRFLGKVKSMDPEKGLVLQRDGVPDVELLESGIGSVAFADRAKIESPAATVNLQLRDGSWFGGDALKMQEGKIFLTLPGGQRLEIPREQARWATLSDDPAPHIYEGPMSIDGWTSGRSNQGKWDYKAGFLRCINNCAVGRAIEHMPDPLDLSFDVLFPLQLQHFGVSLFANGVHQTSIGALAFQFSPQQIHLNHFDGRRYNQYSVNLTPAGDPNAGKAAICRYRLRVDRVNGKALVYVNGVKQADWILSRVKPEDLKKCGPYLSFSPNTFLPDQNFKIGRIRILPWDGKEPSNGEEPADPKGDQVIAGSAPVRDGIIERITGREIVFANQGGVVAREKTLHVRFADPSVAPAVLPQASGLLRLRHGGEFGITRVRGDAGGMTFTTRFGSQLTLPLSTVRDLTFSDGPNPTNPTPGGPGVLTLTDGAQVKGMPVLPMNGGNLRWKIAAARTAIEFPMKEVAGIYFSPGKTPRETFALTGANAVRLSNGDWLPGDIVSMDGNRLVLKNDLTPELTFPLSSVRGLYVNPALAASLADGSTGRELWNKGWNPNRAYMSKEQLEVVSRLADAWSYHDGTYAISGASQNNLGGLARNWSPYAGAHALNFEIESADRPGSFHIQLFNARDERTFSISVFGGQLQVYLPPTTGRLNQFMGGAKQFQFDDPAPSEGRKRIMSIVLDRPARTFRLFIDGREIVKIPFKEAQATEALTVAGMTILPQGGVRQSRIANIWIAPWERVTPKAPDQADRQEPPGNPASEPIVYLSNGDEFTGKVENISADFLMVNSDAGPLELPIKRVAWLQFPGTGAVPAIHFPRLRFNDRGILSVKELHVENERVQCQTLQGQALDFPLSLVREIIYHPAE